MPQNERLLCDSRDFWLGVPVILDGDGLLIAANLGDQASDSAAIVTAARTASSWLITFSNLS
jgi:hypothetical protein